LILEVNLVSLPNNIWKSYFTNQYEPIGINCGKIHLAKKNDNYSEGIIIRVPVTIEVS